MTATSVSRRIAWWSLLAIVFLVPLAMSDFVLPGVGGRLAFSSVEMVKLSLIIILGLVSLAAWASDLLRNGGQIRRTPVDWLILCWLLWVGVTTITSAHWPTSLFGTQGRYEGLVTFATYALIYFLALQLAAEENRVLRLAQTLFLSSTIISIYGLLQYTGVITLPTDLPWDEAERAFATFGNPNMLGGFLAFSVTIALGLALHERRLPWRLMFWLGFGLNGLGVLVTFTRGAWMGGAVGLMLLSIIACRQRAKLSRVDWIPAGVFGAAGVALIVRSLSSATDVTNFGKRLASIFQLSSGSGRHRTQIWEAAAESVRERPLFGWGADTFGLVFDKFKSLRYVREVGGAKSADNAHDYPLQLASGVGVLGVTLFFAIWIWAGVRSWRTVFARSEDSSRLLVGAFWAATVGYLLHLVFGISVPGSTFLIWIALAIVLAPTAHVCAVRPRRRVTSAVATAGVILCAALGIAGQSIVLAADHSYAIAKEDFSGRTIAERMAAGDRAVALNPLVTEHRGAVASLHLEQVGNDSRALKQARQQDEAAEPYEAALAVSIDDAVAAYSDVIDFNPLYYAGYVNLATVYNLAGAGLDTSYYLRAIETARQGVGVVPLGTDVRKRMAEALAATGQTPEAIATLEYCLRLDPRDTGAALALARLYQAAERTPEAIAVLRALDSLAPGQPAVANALRALEEGLPVP